MNINKSTLRKHFSAIRSHIPEDYRVEAAKNAAQIFLREINSSAYQHIACYLAYADEFNTENIIEIAVRAKKYIYLPLVTNNKELQFVRYEPGDALIKNRFGILEPAQKKNIIRATDLDLVITPLLAFDREGHRLGTGGGYYDRTFAFLHKNAQIKPRLMGLGYAAQEATLIPHDEWDVSLQAILTEKELILV